MRQELPANIGQYISGYLTPSQRHRGAVSRATNSIHKETIRRCKKQAYALFGDRQSTLYTVLDLICYLGCQDDELFIQDNFQIETSQGKKYVVDLESPTHWGMTVKYKNQEKEIFFRWQRDEKKLVRTIAYDLMKEGIRVERVSSPCPRKNKSSALTLDDIQLLMLYGLIQC